MEWCKKTMYEIFSFLSIFVIAGFLITNITLNMNVKKLKIIKITTIDNIKEISYNMIGNLLQLL